MIGPYSSCGRPVRAGEIPLAAAATLVPVLAVLRVGDGFRIWLVPVGLEVERRRVGVDGLFDDEFVVRVGVAGLAPNGATGRDGCRVGVDGRG